LLAQQSQRLGSRGQVRPACARAAPVRRFFAGKRARCVAVRTGPSPAGRPLAGGLRLDLAAEWARPPGHAPAGSESRTRRPRSGHGTLGHSPRLWQLWVLVRRGMCPCSAATVTGPIAVGRRLAWGLLKGQGLFLNTPHCVCVTDCVHHDVWDEAVLAACIHCVSVGGEGRSRTPSQHLAGSESLLPGKSRGEREETAKAPPCPSITLDPPSSFDPLPL
jgi:hypothetical protein